MTLWIVQSRPKPHYLFSAHPPTIRYYQPSPGRSNWRVSGRHASAAQAASACLAAMTGARVDCTLMDTWQDEGGSAAAFRANDSPDHESLLWQEEMEAQDLDDVQTRQASFPSSLHDDFFDYEIQPDAAVEFFRTGGTRANPPRLRIQYWAVVGTHFQSGSAAEGDYHLRIVSSGFRDWGRGHALGAFRENLPDDAIIVAQYVTLRFVGRLV